MLRGNVRVHCAIATACFLMLNLAVGCHAYEPLGSTAPTDTRVRVSFAESRAVLVRFADGDSTTRRVRSLKGLVRAFDGDTIRLHDLRIPGGSPDSAVVTAGVWKESNVSVASVGATVEVERLQRGRTALVVTGGVFGGLLLFLAAAMSNFGS